MRPIRTFFLHGAIALALGAPAQRITGELIAAERPGVIYLFATTGHDRVLIDSAAIDGNGRFSFQHNGRGPGFFRLAIAENDQLDLILSPRETQVDIRFDGLPLQEHIAVIVSDENQRLWEYKRASREFGRVSAQLGERRSIADPRDSVELRTIDVLLERSSMRRSELLARLISMDTSSYFAKVVLADQRLTAAIPHGSLAIKHSMAWSDPDLVHSAVYPNAIQAVLQSAQPGTADVLAQASDSLLAWSSGSEVCWRYVRSFLFDLFVQYGADQVVQHLVDNYVVGPGTLYPPEQRILSMVAAQLRVAVGSNAPDIDLPLPGRTDTLKLREFIERNSYVVLFFYSSTCDHCHEQMPLLMNLYREMRPRGVEVIGIALDDNVEDFDNTIREKGLLFPCYTELVAWGSPAAKAFAVKATPSLILLDGNGRIMAKPDDTIELHELLLKLPF